MDRHHQQIENSTQGSLENLERVVLATGNYVNVADGVSLTLHRLVDALTLRNVDVAVVAPEGNHPELAPPHHMISVPSVGLPIQKGYRLSLGLFGGALAQIRDFDPQVVHVATPDIAGLMAAYYARRQGLPLVSTFHTNFASYLRYWGGLAPALTPLAWRLTQEFYAIFDEVYVPTRSMGDDLVARGVLSDYSILNRGVDHFRFNPSCRSESWRNRHGIAADELVVNFCARTVWEKGLRTLVRTLKLLEDKAPPHRCVIVGDGAQKRWLARQLPRAVFTGFLTGHELACAYASADIFLYPSTTDTFGNVTLEAMASGLPVVGARAPGTRTIVEDNESGILVEPDDCEAFAVATTRLLDDQSARRRLADGALDRARQFRWPEIIDRFAADLDRLIS